MNGENGGLLMQIVPFLIICVAMYFVMIRPNSKRRKQEDEMRSNIQIGDEITTIGGIVGKVVSIKDDMESFIIETGSDKNRLKIKKWAIASTDKVEAEAPKK